MKVYILPIIFSSNPKDKESFLLTLKGEKFIVPIVEIKYTEFFHKEALQHIVNFFESDSIKFSDACKYNFLSVQDELTCKYVHKNFDFVEKEDLIICYGGILLQYECLENFQWTKMVNSTQHEGFSPDMDFNILLNQVIQKSIV